MIIKSADFLVSFGTEKQLPPVTKKEVVIVGRSNVGKSSIINKICNRKSLARVSSSPGKTGTINFYGINDFHMVDLPGYGFAKVSNTERVRWDKLINGYFESGRDIALVIQLLDCRHKPSQDDQTMMEYLTHHKFPFVIVLTKGDKLNKTETQKVISEFEDYCQGYSYEKILLTSAPKNVGIDKVHDTIEEYLEK